MPRRRKAVDNGISRNPPTRRASRRIANLSSTTATVAESAGAVSEMSRPSPHPRSTATRSRGRPRRGATKVPNRNHWDEENLAFTTATAADSADAVSERSRPSSRSRSTATRPRGRARRTATRAPIRNPWDEEKLLTSSKSRLIGLDLVRLFAKPEAWTCLDEDEKREILSLLPEHVHPAPGPTGEDGTEATIPPLEEDFLRYSVHWRDGVRQFQTDLENGRCDPEWQRQAEEAMWERAEGRFDKYKEDEFEQFWGQKQKLNYGAISGECTRVRLETLIQEGLVLVGDIWKYSRSFGKGKERILVEKEAQVVNIEGKVLSFVIPPGQRVLLPQVPHAHTVVMHESKPSNNKTKRGGRRAKTKTDCANEAKDDPLKHTDENTEAEDLSESRPTPSKKAKREHDQDQNSEGKQVQSLEQDTPSKKAEEKETEGKPNDEKSSVEMPDHHQEAKPAAAEVEPTATEAEPAATDAGPTATEAGPAAGETTSDPSEKQHEEQSDKRHEEPPSSLPSDVSLILVPKITAPQFLVTKILKTDGRIPKPPRGNCWKEFRCYRNNQDMGNLGEVREAWFFRDR